MRILITGPESSGKSTLGLALSKEIGIPYIPEIARSYLETLNGDYDPKDIEAIAKLNIQSLEGIRTDHSFIHDTYLLNLIIWMQVKYGSNPSWIDTEWSEARF